MVIRISNISEKNRHVKIILIKQNEIGLMRGRIQVSLHVRANFSEEQGMSMILKGGDLCSGGRILQTRKQLQHRLFPSFNSEHIYKAKSLAKDSSWEQVLG